MKYTVSNSQTGLNVAEYEASEPVAPHKLDPAFNGVQFITRDETGEIVAAGTAYRVWSILEFKRRLTQGERVAVRTLARSNPVVEDFMDLLDAASEVRSDDADVAAGLSMLESAGLLGSGRANEILNGE